MSGTLERIVQLVSRGEVRISEHGYDELAQEDIFVADLIKSISSAIEVEDYPNYHKGPCVLALQIDRDGKPIHVVWGIPKAETSPAVLVTAYRPDPNKWLDDFKRRKQ